MAQNKNIITPAQSCSCVEPSLSFATGPTSTPQRIPMHCDVAYESVYSLARSHMIRVCPIIINDGPLNYLFVILWSPPPPPKKRTENN